MQLTHPLLDLSEILREPQGASGPIRISSRRGRQYIELEQTGYEVKLVFFPRGNVNERHSHGEGPIYKILLWGKIRYETSEILEPGRMAWVNAGVAYEGEALEDSLLVLIAPMPA